MLLKYAFVLFNAVEELKKIKAVSEEIGLYSYRSEISTYLDKAIGMIL